jgi:hypothetical protein
MKIQNAEWEDVNQVLRDPCAAKMSPDQTIPVTYSTT